MADDRSTPPACGCKGIRSCLLCESPACGLAKGVHKPKSFVYIPEKGIAKGVEHTDAADWWWFPFPGVTLIEEFVTEDEERDMVHAMDQDEWRLSQSGRRKQDFGPKVNFKKQKIRVANFTGLPSFSRLLWERMKSHTVLNGFLPVEQCNLDYNSDRGSAIDPHLDDSWLWGERLVSLNLLSDTVLTMTSSSTNNLRLRSTLNQHCELNGLCTQNVNDSKVVGVQSDHQDSVAHGSSMTAFVPYNDVEVAIHVPRRSLVILYGDARYNWMHAIHRDHIKQRRVCSTFRELSAEFSAGGKEESQGQMLLDIALGFQGKSV
ncbi:alpha-ketoglutarate-dependent dioxygenase alkB homolog 4 [Hyla sarda]|uniref:alpha-ketoglutarate-dependent dioxygenase alkB homolog 4 n=1 Tax=Hyla sarda TaxID=327740 RepID=UPI0024C39CF2|nr:alpha-ketoglutarate-dependent dioxygenase alkB homolog 4 [Hyla sarda]